MNTVPDGIKDILPAKGREEYGEYVFTTKHLFPAKVEIIFYLKNVAADYINMSASLLHCR